MSAVRTLEYFGNPANPYDQTFEDLDRAVFSGAHVVAGLIIQHLELAYLNDSLVIRDQDDIRYRSTQFDCSAPFHPLTSLFINEGSTSRWRQNAGEEICKEPVRITLGDSFHARDEHIISRWVRLSRPNAKTFGITGEGEPGLPSTWDAITVTLRDSNNPPLQRAWITAASRDEPASLELQGHRLDGPNYTNLLGSLTFALARTIKKLS